MNQQQTPIPAVPDEEPGPHLTERARRARAHRNLQAWPERGEEDTAEAERNGPRYAPVHEPRPRVLEQEQRPVTGPEPEQAGWAVPRLGRRFFVAGGCIACGNALWTPDARPRVPLCEPFAAHRERLARSEARFRRELAERLAARPGGDRQAARLDTQ